MADHDFHLAVLMLCRPEREKKTEGLQYQKPVFRVSCLVIRENHWREPGSLQKSGSYRQFLVFPPSACGSFKRETSGWVSTPLDQGFVSHQVHIRVKFARRVESASACHRSGQRLREPTIRTTSAGFSEFSPRSATTTPFPDSSAAPARSSSFHRASLRCRQRRNGPLLRGSGACV